ncbi:hypothetical protein Len3610_10015 [Lentibacillus sp. CBA3610]|nr:hypothetical protein [Lentibacillus sp. CBA3610]QKY69879.1 hypothetical protein Len3610_10015 [Lentibacillus sp. CBA3610]
MSSKGMQLTKEGKLVIDQLAAYMHEIMGIAVFRKNDEGNIQLEQYYNRSRNSDEQEMVKTRNGKACVSFTRKMFHRTVQLPYRRNNDGRSR